MKPINMPELWKRLQAGEITFDWDGHHLNRVKKPKVPSEYTWEMRRDFFYEEDIAERVSMNGGLYSSNRETYELCSKMQRCYSCGEHVALTLQGDTLKAKTSCAYPEGYPELEVTVRFPTGNLIFADMPLCERPPEMDPTGGSQTVQWELSGTENSSKIDFAHGFCGNSCPGVYVREDRKEILIASPAVNDEGDELPSFPGYEIVGGIGTELWWWTVVDISVAEAKAKEIDTEIRKDGETTVIPGTWKVIQRTHREDRDDYKTETVYARLEWSSDD